MGGIDMRIDVLTLFPAMFDGFVSESILKRAIENQLVDVNIIDFRTYSTNKHSKVDDYPYGGGAGMVLQVQPVHDALVAIPGYKDALKIIVSPQGTPFTQKLAYQYSTITHIIVLCGHYEGYDERIRSYFDVELSIGDYVLTGGELAAMVLIDAITRVIPNVINKDESHEKDSFNNHLLEHPHYTRPREYDGMSVPDVLLNGHHAEINKWRLHQSIQKTKNVRPDLYEQYVKEENND
jgi:tRNA (guanine37-N1)-methyltransferase